MYFARKKGFTLVELLVVISILGILAAALTTQVTKARSMGQAIKCKANLRDLVQSATSYAVDGRSGRGHAFPHAGSFEERRPTRSGKPCYICETRDERFKGWVSWYRGGPWPAESPSPGTVVAFNETDELKGVYAITNGALWMSSGHDFSTYQCPTHVTVAKRKGIKKVRWSYAMNCFFGYDYRGGRNSAVTRSRWVGDVAASGTSASSLLMFAELPAYKYSGGKFNESISLGLSEADGVLETVIKNFDERTGAENRPQSEEIIGFNHQVAKRFSGHVAFADGHVDVVAAPQSPSDQKLKDLTFVLCNGLDIPADADEWASRRAAYLKE